MEDLSSEVIILLLVMLAIGVITNVLSDATQQTYDRVILYKATESMCQLKAQNYGCNANIAVLKSLGQTSTSDMKILYLDQQLAK